MTDQRSQRVAKPPDFQPVKEFPEGHPHAGARRCQAWSNNHGRQCLAIAVRGKNVCKSHGGKTPGGIASPHYKTGHHSKYVLPARLQDAYRLAGSDPELLSLRSEIQVVDARLYDLLSRVDAGEAGKLWASARAAYYTMIDGMSRGSAGADQFNAGLRELEKCLDAGAQDYQAWNEIKDLFELRRRLVESERKREIDLRLYMSAEQAYAYMRELARIITHYVRSPEILQRIQDDFLRATNFGGGIPATIDVIQDNER